MSQKGRRTIQGEEEDKQEDEEEEVEKEEKNEKKEKANLPAGSVRGFLHPSCPSFGCFHGRHLVGSFTPGRRAARGEQRGQGREKSAAGRRGRGRGGGGGGGGGGCGSDGKGEGGGKEKTCGTEEEGERAGERREAEGEREGVGGGGWQRRVEEYGEKGPDGTYGSAQLGVQATTEMTRRGRGDPAKNPESERGRARRKVETASQ